MKSRAQYLKELKRRGVRADEIKSYMRGYFNPNFIKRKTKQKDFEK